MLTEVTNVIMVTSLSAGPRSETKHWDTNWELQLDRGENSNGILN